MIIQYLEEGDDETVSPTMDRDSKESQKPIPRAMDMDVKMEDNSVPEESDIVYDPEVMTGYCYNPVVPTSGGVEPLASRCAHGADNNETISFDPKQIASTNVRQNSTSSDPERVAYDLSINCDTSPRNTRVPNASEITNLTCSTQGNKLATSAFVPTENN